jgi:hypothetical protein
VCTEQKTPEEGQTPTKYREWRESNINTRSESSESQVSRDITHFVSSRSARGNYNDWTSKWKFSALSVCDLLVTTERQVRSRSIPAAEAEEILPVLRDEDTELNSNVNITGSENVRDSNRKSTTTIPNESENCDTQ